MLNHNFLKLLISTFISISKDCFSSLSSGAGLHTGQYGSPRSRRHTCPHSGQHIHSSMDFLHTGHISILYPPWYLNSIFSYQGMKVCSLHSNLFCSISYVIVVPPEGINDKFFFYLCNSFCFQNLFNLL